MELDYKEIGKRVKIARIRADLTQEALAEKAGLSIPRKFSPMRFKCFWRIATTTRYAYSPIC